NDWCSEADGRLDPARVTALLGAYSSLRRFHPAEAQLWPTMLRVACLRFWLSRLIAAEENRDRGVLIKDPDEFRRLLEQRQQIDSPLPFALYRAHAQPVVPSGVAPWIPPSRCNPACTPNCAPAGQPAPGPTP